MYYLHLNNMPQTINNKLKLLVMSKLDEVWRFSLSASSLKSGSLSSVIRNRIIKKTQTINF